MPFIDKKEGTKYTSKITKKQEKALIKSGLKAYDVRYGVSFPKGGKIKVWAKNKDDASMIGSREQTATMMNPTSYASAPSVRNWKKPNHPKTRIKRKDNPRFVPVKIKRTHPKTGKKFTQIVYKHSKNWWRK